MRGREIPLPEPTDNGPSRNTNDKEPTVSLGSLSARLKSSLIASSGTIVFGMEDGAVSIFGLVFGVAATTTSTVPVLIAGASGAAAAAGLKPELSGALSRAVQQDRQAFTGLLLALEGGPEVTLQPMQHALWMLAADFFSAAVPIVPFMLLPIGAARLVSATITALLLTGLGIGRARIAERSIVRTASPSAS